MALKAGVPGEAAAPLALTMGDPAGIGLDIALDAYTNSRDGGASPFFLIGDIDALRARARLLGRAVVPVEIARAAETVAAFAEGLPVLSERLEVPPEPGRPHAPNGAAVVRCIAQAVELCLAGDASAVVTNPIAKSVLYSSGFTHPGHTEYLAYLARRLVPGWQGAPVMMLAADELKVVPLTVHVALRSVPDAISRDLIVATARTLAASLRTDYGIASPRIAVAGLNPHAGEVGSMGREEIDAIAPAIASLNAEGIAASGPHPADTLFHAEARARYDACLAMYHDQALIPLKTLAFDRGVNVTLGLPFVRTSPDHGPAFDIAGTGKARAESLIAALRMAGEVAARRRASDAT